MKVFKFTNKFISLVSCAGAITDWCRIVGIVGALLIALVGNALAQDAQQVTSQSWHGLSGLFVIPTARLIGKSRMAVGYSESKHVEIFSYSRFMDRQIRAPITFGIGENTEICAQFQSNQYDVSLPPTLANDEMVVLSAKFLICAEKERRPAIAFAIRDIGNSDRDVDPLEEVHNGRKYFLIASKRLVVNKETGRFVDAHLGFGHSRQSKLAPLFGVEIALTPVASFIAEGMWDSPFVNFREAYVNAARYGTSKHKGRFVFDTGLRLYPDVVPGLVVDLGVVGDGSMEFSFGVGYVTK